MTLNFSSPKWNTKRAGLLISAVIVALLGAHTLRLIFEQQSTVREVSRYHVTWMISQTALGVARLTAVAAAYDEPDLDVSKEDVQLRLDVLENHLALMTAGDTGRFVASDTELTDIVTNLRNVMNSAQPLVARLDQDGSSQPLVALLMPLNSQLPKLASSAYLMNGNLVANSIDRLNELYLALSLMLLLLLTGSFGLAILSTYHNRLLNDARLRSQRLVAELQQSAEELQTANAGAQRAKEEVDERNRVLIERDFSLMTQNLRFDAALNNMSQALCMADDEQRLIVCNVRFRQLFGLREEEVSAGTKIGEIFRLIRVSKPSVQPLLDEIWHRQQVLARGNRHGTFFEEGDDGLALAISHRPMAGGGWVATYEDITERRRVEARISYLAHHDAVTELPNRVLFTSLLDEAVRRANEWREGVALLFLDLDRFKEVNDTLGHPAGDVLLEKVAQRLRNCVREVDVVSRFGGDEFAILMRSVNHRADAEALAQRIVSAVGEPYELDGRPAIVSTSIGIVWSAGDHASSSDMLKAADMALYRAKAEGKATFRFFEASMNDEVLTRREMELDLREAVKMGQLELWYQPVFDLSSGEVCACEALLRWRHPERGLVMPGQFITFAEEVGLIEEIGSWALRQAALDAAAWPSHIVVAVNISPLQFRSGNLANVIRDAVRSSGLDPRRLEVEITETALLRASDKVIETLHELRGFGIRMALDDFGTGYSSLSYLRSFPFERIKIDRSFVAEMGQRPDCLAIVNSIVRLAQDLGMSTTAEGVETQDQLGLLRSAGCTAVQGYYFAKPEPLRDAARWLNVEMGAMQLTG